MVTARARIAHTEAGNSIAECVPSVLQIIYFIPAQQFCTSVHTSTIYLVGTFIQDRNTTFECVEQIAVDDITEFSIVLTALAIDTCL